MAGKFELSKAKNGQFYFVLKGSNGQVILQSEMYQARTSAKNGIASVQKNSARAERYIRKESKNGKWMFNLKAGNHQIIGSSEMYDSTKARENGIASVQKIGPTAAIKDLTE